ncbi:DUF4232 domain-containing protein [Streptomyces sp. Je 1-4]|uniref:DUF4232 domain-containing protein n=1 Tax=Streptomyces TaxID=1883 RepID=UPI00140F492E|nr:MULTISPECIES: DUF4232 domain-containing protein [unclassified Streptomyces]QIK05022.1 DUF4232 domain-containing protein [Streptomyces sp. ID38640]UYB38200.1 DUF4232 domain-containing protein [Streptomyces sp. Je 1-4]UZQ34142.1 DUF4232 domain-containing protein [Streptomyces sp. Je 1-4] [Streptomyces sp. Je 1-4 4N24]UZQ41560.1 DUF4232 domain-containing protein [Streptomyces sp. Je 1-4] [Streptomyces sp. Je 1-4 4N24_ara]
MTKRGLRTAATVAAAVALVAGASAGVASAAGTAGSGAAADVCRPGTLKVTTTDAGSGQAGMNHEGTYLKVTNTGNSTCAIGGYPGLALEGAGHEAIKTTAHHGDTYFAKDPGMHGVTLKPGKSAYADLVWTHAGPSSAKAKYLQVSPTGSNAHSVVAFDKEVDGGELEVTAWSAKLPSAS